jgi:hypothetical protein
MAGLDPAIYVFFPKCAQGVDARVSQTSLRSLRKADCYARA